MLSSTINANRAIYLDNNLMNGKWWVFLDQKKRLFEESLLSFKLNIGVTRCCKSSEISPILHVP